MDQELEQRVNDLVSNTGLTFKEALAKIQAEDAEKKKNELLKAQDAAQEDTSSESSGGTFEFIGSPEVPEISPLLPEASRQYRIDIYNQDVSNANALAEKEFIKLKKLAVEESSPERRQDLYNLFIEETGAPIEDSVFAELDLEISAAQKRQADFEAGYNEVLSKSSQEGDFSLMRAYLESYGVEEEKIQEEEKEFRSWSDKERITEGQVLESWKSSYTTEEFVSQISALGLSQEAIAKLEEDYSSYLEHVGQGAYNAVYDLSYNLSEKIRKLTEEGRIEVENSDYIKVAEQVYEEELALLKDQYADAKEREAEIYKIAKEQPDIKPALAFVAIGRSQFVSELPEEFIDVVRKGDLDMYEAAWLSSQEYSKFQDYIKGAGGLSGMVDERTEQMEEAKEAFIEQLKNEQHQKETERIKQLTSDYDDDQRIAFENALYRVSGSKYDLNGDGIIGVETPAIADAIMLFQAAALELPFNIASAGAYLRNLFDEAVDGDEEDEELAELLERRRANRDKGIRYYLDPGILESTRESLTKYEKGVMDSFRDGQIGNALSQSLNMAAESLPLTLATMAVSAAATPAVGFVFAGAIASGLEYEQIFDKKWFMDLSPWEKSAYVGGIGAAEGLSEALGAGVASRLTKGVRSRAIGEVRKKYIKDQIKATTADYLTDAGSEVSVVYAGAGLDLAFNSEADFSNLTDEAIESGFVSFFMSGGMQIGGAINSIFATNTDPDVLVYNKDLQARITNILQTTKPGSKVRVEQMNMLLEDSSLAAELKMDSYEFQEFIRSQSSEASDSIAKNSRKIAGLMSRLHTATTPSEVKGIRNQIESLVAENRSLQEQFLNAFVLSSESVNNESIDKLANRASLFSRQATKLENEGKKSAADSLRKKVDRINDQIETIKLRRDIKAGLKDGSVISSEGRDAVKVSQRLIDMGVNGVVVDEAIAEQLKKEGYAEVAFNGSQDGQKLMIKGAAGLDLNTAGMSIEDAVAETNIRAKQKSGELTAQEIENELFFAQMSGAELSPAMQELDSQMTEEAKQKLSDRIERVKNRKASDLQLETPIDRGEIAVSEENTKLKDRLASVTGLKSDNVGVISEDEAFRRAYSQQRTDEGRAAIEQAYLDGSQTYGGFYDKVDGKVFITDTATSKDIVEEFAHATIHKKLNGFDRASVDFKRSLISIMSSDPSIQRDVAAKRAHYEANFNMTPEMLQEELFVEIFASYVSNELLVKESTKSAIAGLVDKLTGGRFLKSGGEIGVVMRKLSQNLSDDIFDEDAATTDWDKIFSKEQEELSDFEQIVKDANSEAFSSYRNRPTFLDNKTVTFVKVSPSRYRSEDIRMGDGQKTFNDYYHFVNWYRKMTGNGRLSRIGAMSYVDNEGNVKSLKPPKPLIDKSTGEPVWMDAVMKSYDQLQMDRNQREIDARNALRAREFEARSAINMMADQIHDTIKDVMAKRKRLSGWGNGNTIALLEELMEDWTPRGTVVEGQSDKYGRVITEKISGTPEFREELLLRTNEWLEENMPGESVLFSSRRATVNALFTASAGLTADQKRKNIDRVIKGAVKTLGLNSPIIKELEAYVDGLKPGKLGGNTPRSLVNALLIANDTYYLSKKLDANSDPVTKEQLLDMYTKKLVAFDKLFDRRGRDFYKTAEQSIEDIISAVSQKPLPTGQGGVILSENPELAKIAETHKNLLKVIIAVTSNGSKAQVNLQEATAIYSVVINELQDELNKKRSENPSFKGSKAEKAWIKAWSGGPRTRARLELVSGSDILTTTRFSPGRGVVMGKALTHLLDIYDFSYPAGIKRKLGKKSEAGGEAVDVVAQLSTKEGGFGKKIGAFAMNLLGDKTVITQDLHVVESLDRVFRPNKSASVDLVKLHRLMQDEMTLSESEINEIEKKNDWVLYKQENPDGTVEKIYDAKKVIKWLKDKGASKINGVCGKVSGSTVIRRFIEENLVPKGKPLNNKERIENSEVIKGVHSRLKNVAGYSRVTLADVGQMIFLENHAAQNAFGASSRTYEDFYGEAADQALSEWETNLVAGFEEFGFTAKHNYLNKLDKLDIIDDSKIQELSSLAEAGKLNDKQLKYLSDLTFFRENFPETVNMLQRAEMSDVASTDPVFFSSKKMTRASDHPQANAYNIASFFKGKEVSNLGKVRMKSSTMNVNKLLEGRASELDMKAKVNSYGPAENYNEIVDGVVLMRNPLHSDSFVDMHGNRLVSADNAVISGDVMIVSGNIKMSNPMVNMAPDKVDVTSPEHFAAFQNFVSILKQRNPSLADSSNEMFEIAYMGMKAKDRARFANLTVDEHGNVIKGRRLRGTSKRVASSSEFGRFKKEIINNPSNYIDRQKIADQKKALEEMSPQELVTLMRGDALNNLATRNDDVGVLAGIELINRLQNEGNDIGIVSVLNQLAPVGTTAGRVLRHMAELKTSSPQGMASVIITKAEAQGKILTDAQKQEILNATKEYMRAYRMAEQFMERGIAGEDVENLFKRAQEDLSAAERDLDTLANKYIEKSWAEIGQQLVQGNLLTMMSQARNVVYNIANIIPKTIVDISSMPTSKAFELLGLHKEPRKMSLAAYLYAMRKFGAGTLEAMEQVITGREKDLSEWRMSRGFMPIRSLMHAMSTDLPEGKTIRDEFNQRAKLLVQGTFGIPAEAMFRLLSLGDVPFRRFAEGLELYNIGKGKGLEGDALAQFLKFPDKDSADAAATEGRKLTFQEPMGLARGSMWIIDNISRGMGQAFKNVKGFDAEGFFKFLIRLNVPYVSTIANFTEETLTYASPVFGGGKMAIQMSNGEYTEASKTLSKVMVGQTISSASLYLISKGLLSGSVDWEDDEKTNLMYDTFPPNSINVSGLRRLLNGEDPAPQAGDEFRSYQTLGVFGTIMGAYAHSTSPEAAKEMADQPFSGNNVLKKLFGFDNVSVVAYMMDQSFLQGLNGITSVIASTKDPDDFERAFFKYVETISKAFSSMFLPNVLSGIDQATREHLPDKRDIDLTDRIKNHVRERTFNTGGLPVKVNWKGERIDQAPVGGNQFAYYMFDATKKKEASQDEVSIEILNLYLETGTLTKAVGTPYYASSVYRKLNPPSVSRGKAKKAYEALGVTYQFLENPEEDFFVRLTAEEINNALEMSNTLRYNDIKSFMQTEEYQGMTSGEKIEALDEINDRYKSLLSYNPDGSFAEHSKYILGIMEKRYLEQYGQD